MISLSGIADEMSPMAYRQDAKNAEKTLRKLGDLCAFAVKKCCDHPPTLEGTSVAILV
jgi:hypothetical protein